MSFWTLDRVHQALREVAARPLIASPLALGGVSTDTRAITPGDLFVALRGEHFDAHDFLADAVARGAAALVVQHPERTTGLGRPVVAVRDTTQALGALGAYRRHAWGGTVVAVAGSNGKTTTKELLRTALDGVLTVHATHGNLNNQIGVPLTLLAIPDAADIAVVEIGTNYPGEVDLLRRLVTPDVAVVTSIGEEHLEGLGDVAGVLREETAVFRDVSLAIAPAAQPEVGRAARGLARETIEAGLDAGDVRPDHWGVDEEGRGWAEFSDARLVLRLRGVHNLRNAMLALAVARACGVPRSVAVHGLSNAQPLSMRGVWEHLGDMTLINDAYNANPASMREAIGLLNALPGPRQRVLVIGTMRELGGRTLELHRDVARSALDSRANVVAGIGEFAGVLPADGDDGRVVTASDIEGLWPQLRSRLARDAVVLLKASRGVKLERLVPLLKQWAERSET